MARHLAMKLGAAALLVSIAACGSSGSKAKAAAPGPTKATTAQVAIKTFAFGPKDLQVAAGTVVTWTNQDQILHTVTSGTRGADAKGQPIDVQKDGAFDAKLDGVGKSASYTFSKAGTFTYFCDLHPGMDATVVVS